MKWILNKKKNLKKLFVWFNKLSSIFKGKWICID